MFQLLDLARSDVIHAAMDGQAPGLDGVDHVVVLQQDPHPLPNILLDQKSALLLCAEVGPALSLSQFLPQAPDGQQPVVQQAKAVIAQGGVDAAAARVAAQHHVLDLEVHNRVGDDGGGAKVAAVQHVGDVAVHEDVAGQPAEDGRLGHTRVGAAEPEDAGGLALGERGEEIRVGVADVGRPFLVGGEVLFESVAVGVRLAFVVVVVVGVVYGERGKLAEGTRWSGSAHSDQQNTHLLAPSLRFQSQSINQVSW